MVLQLISGPFNEHKIAYIFCLEDPVKVFIEIKFFIKDFFILCTVDLNHSDLFRHIETYEIKLTCLEG